MSATELSNQLAALSDSLKTANTLISRLAKLHLQPGAEPLTGNGGSARVELAHEIHASLKDLDEELDFLKQEAEDLQTTGASRRRQSIKDTEEARLIAKAVRLGEELKHSRQRFRNAQLTAKAASEQAKRTEREALFESYRKQADLLVASNEGASGSATEQLFAGRGKRNQEHKQANKDEILVNASSDVTAALRRTHDLLSAELSRSRFAQETLEESTAALNGLSDDYGNLDSILSNSRNLLGTLLRSQKSDTWYLETAFYILVTTFCWLFFRRILFGPFVKLPLFLWNLSTFSLHWLVLKPFWLFLTATGIIVSEPAPYSASRPSTTRKPLIVHRSAQSGPSAHASQIQEQLRSLGVPAGAGGAGVRQGHVPGLKGEMSEKIGKMAEESAKEDPQSQNHYLAEDDEKNQNEPARRGDGTILQERTQPANPKKKVFEAGKEDNTQQRVRKRDEL